MSRLALLIVIASAALCQDGLPSKEVLTYNIEWRLINAGKGRLTWGESHNGWQIDLHLESTGMVSKLFKVNDDYTSTMRSDLCAVSSHLKSEEGRRRRETDVAFDAEAKKAHYLERDLVKNTVLQKKDIEIPSCVHDVLGALFLLRTLHLEPGQSTTIPVSDGKKSVIAKVEAQQRETVKTLAGTFQAIRYEAYLFNDVLYRRSGRLFVWISEDERRIPVQIRVKLQFTIGTITLQLDKEQEKQ